MKMVQLEPDLAQNSLLPLPASAILHTFTSDHARHLRGRNPCPGLSGGCNAPRAIVPTAGNVVHIAAHFFIPRLTSSWEGHTGTRTRAHTCKVGNVHPGLQRTGGVQVPLLREMKRICVGQALPHIRIRGGRHGNSCWKHGLAGKPHRPKYQQPADQQRKQHRW